MNRTKLKLRSNLNSFEYLPQKLIDLQQQWADEDARQKAAALKNAQGRQDRKQRRKEKARYQILQEECEAKMHQHKVERFIQKWEEEQKRLQQKEVEAKVEAERLGRDALERIRVEQEWRDGIWTVS